MTDQVKESFGDTVSSTSGVTPAGNQVDHSPNRRLRLVIGGSDSARVVFPGITVIALVYGHPEYVDEALDSVVALNCDRWELLIADNGSAEDTYSKVKVWLNQHSPDERIHYVRRDRNIGLFPNLNRAIQEASTDWVVIFCTDDRLDPDAIETLESVHDHFPDARLIISTFEQMDALGGRLPASHAANHDTISPATTQLSSAAFISALLRVGSVAGNLTGVAFSRDLWIEAGGFREDWLHAADWEWILRASELSPVALNRKPIATVRTHSKQESGINRQRRVDLPEAAEVVRRLREHPSLADEPLRNEWAAHLMQYHLWTLLKDLTKGEAGSLRDGLRQIDQAAGLPRTSLEMVRWLPQRIRVRRATRTLK